MRHRMVLTPKQKETYDLLKEAVIQRGESPTIDELRKMLGLSSLRSVTQRLEALEAKGYIKRDRFRHRGVSIIEPKWPFEIGGIVQLPVIASAGCPAVRPQPQEKSSGLHRFYTVPTLFGASGAVVYY